MAVKVEVFSVDDEIAVEDQTERELREKACERLGLHGQLSLTRGFQFKTPTAEELLVYQTLFPERTDISSYSIEAIPLRVLDVYEAAKNSDLFQVFEIWGPVTKKPDPVLVGVTKHPQGRWYGKDILLARWGSSLEEFPALVKQAREKLIQNAKDRALEAIARAKSQIEMLSSPEAKNIGLNKIPTF